MIKFITLLKAENIKFSIANTSDNQGCNVVLYANDDKKVIDIILKNYINIKDLNYSCNNQILTIMF